MSLGLWEQLQVLWKLTVQRTPLFVTEALRGVQGFCRPTMRGLQIVLAAPLNLSSGTAGAATLAAAEIHAQMGRYWSSVRPQEGDMCGIMREISTKRRRCFSSSVSCADDLQPAP